MKFCKRVAVVTRKITFRNFKRPVSTRGAIRSVSIKVFPTLVDTLTNTHDLKTSMITAAELEMAVLGLEVALIMLSITSKKMSENKSSSEATKDIREDNSAA